MRAAAAAHASVQQPAVGAEPVQYGDGLVDRVRQLAPERVNAVADLVGGQLETTLAVLPPGGRHASIIDVSVKEQGGSHIWVRPTAARPRASVSWPPPGC